MNECSGKPFRYEGLRINHEIVWETVAKHVPALKEEVSQILSQFPAD